MEAELQLGLSGLLKVAKGNPLLIEVKSNKLFMGTYSDYHKVVYEFPCDHEDFRAVFSDDIVKDLPHLVSGDFTVSENSITFKRGKDRTDISLSKEPITLTGLSKGYEKKNLAHFLGSEIRSAFSYVKHASNDKSLGDVVLRGFHLTLDSNKAEVMSSNGFMLSVVPVQQTNDEFNQSDILILNSDFFNAVKLVDDEYDVHIGYNDSALSLTQEADGYILRVITSLTKGNPLPYQKVLKEVEPRNKTQYVVDKNSFVDALRGITIFSEDRAEFGFYNTGEVSIFTSGDRGSATREVDVKSFTLEEDLQDSIKINFNPTYLTSFLSSVKSEELSINLAGPKSPVLFLDNFGKEVISPLLK